VKDNHLTLPIVVRLEGNNAELAHTIVRDSGLNILSAPSMAEAAEQVVQAAKNVPPVPACE
jgi:succinyl-CoA synthetase beta subunit